MLRMTVLTMLLLMPIGVMTQERFDVASVKRSNSTSGRWGFTLSGFSADTELYWIISAAFEIPPGMAGVQMAYPPSAERLLFSRFEVEARGEGDGPAMLREVLRDRFGLQARRETQQRPIYALQVKTPGKLKPSTVNCVAVRKPGVRPPDECLKGRFAGTVAEALKHDLGIVNARPVVDQTGLTGNYDWTVTTVVTGNEPEERFNRLRDALEDQLGLTLKAITGPYEVLVIDALHEPTPN